MSLQQLAAFSHAIEFMNLGNPLYRKMELYEFLLRYGGENERQTKRFASSALKKLWDQKGTGRDVTRFGVFEDLDSFRVSVARETARRIEHLHTLITKMLRLQLNEAARANNQRAAAATLEHEVDLFIDFLLKDGSPYFIDGKIITASLMSKARFLMWQFSATHLAEHIPVDAYFAFPPAKLFDILIQNTPWNYFYGRGK